MSEMDKTVTAGYQVAWEKSRDETAKVPCCTDAVVALLMESHVQGAASAHKPESIATVVVDEVDSRSVQSDYTLALTLLAMQLSDKIRLVAMSATGDHDLVESRIPECQRPTWKRRNAQDPQSLSEPTDSEIRSPSLQPGRSSLHVTSLPLQSHRLELEGWQFVDQVPCLYSWHSPNQTAPRDPRKGS